MGAGLLVALHATAADIALLSLVLVLVYFGQHMSLQHAILRVRRRSGRTFADRVFCRFLADPPVGTRTAFARGSLCGTVADDVIGFFLSTASPPASKRAIEAYSALSRMSRSHTIQCERCLSLLSQAERIRLSILMLGRAVSPDVRRLRPRTVSDVPNVPVTGSIGSEGSRETAVAEARCACRVLPGDWQVRHGA
jgi:hypothetical protein